MRFGDFKVGGVGGGEDGGGYGRDSIVFSRTSERCEVKLGSGVGMRSDGKGEEGCDGNSLIGPTWEAIFS